MTNEKMLQYVNKALSSKNAELMIESLFQAKKYIEEDIRKDVQKSKGIKVKRDTLLKKIFSKDIRKEFFKKCIPCNAQYGYVDGYRAYVLNNDYGYSKSDSKMDIISLKPKEIKNSIKIDIKDLTFFVKKEKAKAKKSEMMPYVVIYDSVKIGLNPTYLLEALQMFDTETIYTNGNLSPIFFQNDQKEWGILCPVRLKDSLKI